MIERLEESELAGDLAPNAGRTRTHMAALRKKIAEKKAASDPPAQPVAAQRPTAPAKEDGLIKAGFLQNGELYPDGSNEAAPSGWRQGGVRANLTLTATPENYVVEGDFKEAGHYLGKEDFNVEKIGLTLRVKGKNKAASEDASEAESLVSGLDEVVQLPPDAAAEGLQAEFAAAKLKIVIPRLRDGPLAELVASLSLSDAQAVGATLEREAAAVEGAEAAGGGMGS